MQKIGEIMTQAHSGPQASTAEANSTEKQHAEGAAANNEEEIQEAEVEIIDDENASS